MRRNRLSLILILASLALSLIAAANLARPVGAVTNNSHVITTAVTSDHYIYESSYQNPGFYANGLYWVFYEDSNPTCEHQGGCFYYVTSADGSSWSSSTIVSTPGSSGIHVTDSDWSVTNLGTQVYYARYNESSFGNDCNRALLYGTGTISGASITWQSEQVVRNPSPTLAFPNTVITIDSNNQVWIGYQEDSHSACGGTGRQTARIVHANSQPLPAAPLGASFAFSPSSPLPLQDVNFTATAAGGTSPYSYGWLIDGSVIGTGQSFSYNFTTPGAHQVTLTSKDSSNQQQIVVSTREILVGLLPPQTNSLSLQVPSGKSVRTGTTISFTVNSSDTDTGETVTTVASSLPQGANFNSQTGLLTWTPTADESNKTWILTFNATDNGTPPLFVTNQVLIEVSPLWTGDIILPATTLSQSISANWHVDIAALSGGEVYAGYWANNYPFFGRLFDGSVWQGEDGISLTSESTDVNSFIFGSGSTVYAVWFDSNKGTLNAGIKPQGQTWQQNVIGSGEAKSVCGLPGNVSPSSSCSNQHRYSLPYTATFDLTSGMTYVFWYNQTRNVIDEWSGSGVSWRSTPGAFTTQRSGPEYPITSFHYSTNVNGKDSWGIIWLDGLNAPYSVNFAIETVGTLPSFSTDASWNPLVHCTPVNVSIEQILGGQDNASSGGATESGSIFNPGILAQSPGDAKRWLTPSSFTNTLTGWQSGGPPCTITNADGQVVSAFVEVLGVQRGALLNEDFTTNFDHVNGGGPYPNSKGYYDTTFNLFTPGFDVCSPTNSTGCMHTIHLEIDHDWKAAGYCGPATSCDPYQLAAQTSPYKSLIDVQGFIYWDPDHANEPGHSFSGWEIHPVTAWRISCRNNQFCSPSYSLSASPSTLTLVPGQKGNSTIVINTFNLYNQSVPLTATVTPSNPSDPTATLTPFTVPVPPCNQCNAANSTLTVTALSSSSGTYIVTVDGFLGTPQHRTTTVTVQVQGFSLQSNPQSLMIPAGGSVNSTITLTSLGSFSGPVNLSALQTGCTCGFQTKFSPGTVTLTVGGTATSILTVTAGSTTGNAVVTVTGTSGSLTSSTTVSVSGVDFTVASNPATLNVLTNRPANSTISIAGVNGFTGTVSLSDTVPASLTCSFGPTSISLNSTTTTGRSNLSCSGPPGNYTVIITGSGNGVVHTTNFSIRVQDFTIAANPTGLEVNINSPGSSTIQISAVNGFTGTIAVSQNGGSACNLSHSSVVLNSTTTSVSITLNCTYTATGNTNVLVTSTFGPLIHTASVAFQVVDFTVAASPTSFTVNAGSLTNSTINLGQLNGFNRTVTLSIAPQSGLICSLSSNSINLATGPISSFLSCKSATAGNYSVTVTGTNANLSHITSSIQVQVVDFQVTPNISSLSLPPGQSSTSPSIHLTSINGFTGTVTINIIVSPFVASGPTATSEFNSLKLTPTGNSTGLTINAGQIAGIYNLNITATNGQLTRWAIITLTVPTAKPNISTTLSAPTILAGSSASDSATLIGTTNNAGGTVTYYLSAGGSCTGPTSIISTVTVTNGLVPNSRPVFFNSTGTYGFNATYSGDSNNAPASTHTCESLTVQKDTPTIATSLSPSAIQVGQSATDSATLSNFFQASGTVNYNLFKGSNSCTGPTSTVSTVTVTNGIIPSSRSVQFNSTNPGGYSFQAAYSGDGNNTIATSSCEPLAVNPVGVTITTNLSSNTITVGGTDSDSSTLSGQTSTAGGTVTYNEFANGICSSPGKAVSISAVTNGAVPTSRSVIFNSTGTFSFDAVYSGDANNNGATSACEPLTVNKASPTISTSISPQTAITVGSFVTDQATITGGYPTSGITGTVTYTFYSFASLPSSTSPCSSGTVIGTPQTVALGSSGSVPSSAAVAPSPAGFYGFSAAYNGDGNNTATTSNCEPLTVNKQTPTMTTTVNPVPPVIVGTSVTDQATITGGFPSTGLTGTITYNYFSTNGACSGPPASIKTVSVGPANSVASSGPQTPNSVGQYSFNATYSGDANNNPATSSCEAFTVNPISTITGVACSSPIIVGVPTSCTVTVSDVAPGTLTPSGTVTWASNSTQGVFAPASACNLSGSGSSATCSVNYTPSLGPQNITATYPGDSFHVASSGSAILHPGQHSTTTSISCSSPALVGQPSTCKATVTDTSSIGATSPTGTVSFTHTGVSGSFNVTSCTLISGTVPTASCSVAFTGSGSGSAAIIGTFSGDSTHASSSNGSSPFTITVNPALVVNTPVVTPAAIDSGQSSGISAAFTGGTPTFSCQWLQKAPGASVFSNLGSSSTCTSPVSITTPSLSIVGTWSFELQITDSSASPVTVTSSSATITVNTALTAASISASPPALDSGQSSSLSTGVSFTGGTPSYNCQWLKKGPADSSYSNLGAAFSCLPGDKPSATSGALGTTGIWSFELQVTDGGTPSEVVMSNSASVTVSPVLSAATISANPTSIDSGQTSTLTTTVSFSGGTSTYNCEWLEKSPGATAFTVLSTSFTCKSGDLPNTSTGPLATAGGWLFQLQVNDSGTPVESASSNSVLVSVSGPLSAGAITPASPTVDSGQGIVLTSNPSGGNTPYTYQWYSDTVCTTAIASATSPTYTATPTTTTTFSYKVTDSSSSSQCSPGDSVTVSPALVAGAVTPVSPNIDSGQSIILTANPSGGTVPYQYQWKSGSSTTCSLDTTLLGTLATQSVSPTASTFYCYTVTDSAFAHVAQSSATDLVNVRSVLVAGPITPANPTIDSGQSITLTANPTGGTTPYSFQWYSGASSNCISDTSKIGTSQTQTVSPTVSTYYCYLVIDASQGLQSENATSSTDLVVVNSILSIPTISATSPIDSGQSTTVDVSWTGGTSPYTVNLYTSTSPSICSGLVQVGHTVGITGSPTTFTESPTSTAYYCATVIDNSLSTTQTSTPSTVVVNPQPIANAPSAIPSIINTGQSSSLSASFTGGTAPFACQWLEKAPGASSFSLLGTSSSCTSPSAISTGTLTNVGSWSFELRLTDSGSPSVVVTSLAVVVTVNGALTAGAISPASPAIDSGQSITMSSNVLGGTSPYSYQWYSDGSCNTSIPSATLTTYTASPTSTTTYSYKVTDSASSSQCSPSDTLTVNPVLIAGGVIPTSPSIDNGQSITLTANPSGGTGPYQYHWYSAASLSCPAGAIIGTSATIIVSPSSNTYYCYTVSDSSAGTPLVSATSPADLVTVNPALIAGPISPSNPAIDSGQSVILVSNPSSGTTPYHFAWYSDGTCLTPIPSANGSTFSTSPTTTSTYSYKLTDSANTPASICSAGDTVTVNPAVIASAITPSNPTIDNGQSIVLTSHGSQGASPLSYQWYSDGVCTTPILSGTSTTIIASPSATTIYSYKVTDSSNTPASACSPADTVTVNPTLVAGQIAPSSPVIDAGQSITLTSHSSGGTASISYRWFADGTCTLPISGATSPTYTTNPSVQTTYSYSVTDSALSPVSQCSAGDIISVSTALVAGSITPSGPTIDTGQTVTLSANPSGGTAPYSYQWYSTATCAGPITGATSSTYVASPSSTTTYSYKASDSSQGTPLPSACSPGDTVTVSGPVSAGPVTPASPSIDTGQSIILSANPTGGTLPYSYQWYFDGACTTAISSATQSMYTISPTVAGTYSYKVTDSTSASACSAGDTVTVNTGLVAGAITPTSPSIDDGQTVTLMSAPSGGTVAYSFQWYTGTNCVAGNLIAGAISSSHIFSPTVTTSYSYRVSDSSQGTPTAQACSSADTVTVNSLLSAGSPSPSSPTIDSGQSIILASTASGGTSPYSYQWFSDGACTTIITSATSANYLATPTISTTYSYKVTDSASTPSSRCSTGDTVTVSPSLVAGAMSPGGPTVDSGQSIVLTVVASGGTTPYTYQWFSGTSATCSADTTLLGTSSTQSVNPTSNTYYCYSVSDSAFAHATQQSITDLVTVSPPLVAGPISPSSPTIDQGQSVTLMANPSGGTTPYFYQWYSGTSSTCSSDTAPLGTSSTQSVSSSSTAYYCYKVTDSAAGSPSATASSQTDLVTVNPVLGSPSVVASSPIDSGQSTSIAVSWAGGTSPYTVTLYTTSTSTCSALTQVAQNTGLTGTTTMFTQSPASTASYCVSVSDSAATPATTQSNPQTVTVNPVLTVNPSSANPSTLDLGQTSSLSATFLGGTPPYLCQWLEKAPGSSIFSNLGSSSTCSQTSSISTSSLSVAGSWSFELQVSDSASSAVIVISAPTIVTVNPALTSPTISGPPTPIDSGQSSTVSTSTSFTGGTAPYTCQWLRKGPLDPGYGSLGSAFSCIAGDKPTISTGPLSIAGSWSYELQVSDSGSPAQVKVSNQATVTVIGALSAGAISPGAPTLDFGQSITLTANAAGGQSPYTYQWYSDGSCKVAISSAKSSSYVASPIGTNAYSYNVTDKSLASQCSPADVVTVNSALSLGPISPVAPTIDNGQSISLSVTVTGGTTPYSYQWFSDASCTTAITGATNSVYIASPSTTATYTYKVGDASQGTPQATQCSSADTVSVNPAIAAGPVTPSNPTIDSGQSVLLVSHTSGGTTPLSYQWFADGACGSLITGATSATFSALPVSTTTYSYKVTDSAFTPQSQCSAGDTITVASALVPGSITPAGPSIDNGQSITLTANPSGGSTPYSYQWYSGTSPTCSVDTTGLGTGPTQTVSPSVNTYYCYSVTDATPATQSSSTDLVTVNPALVAGSITPVSPVIDNGESITLVANPTGGTMPYHYQWYSSPTSSCPSGGSIGSASTLKVSPTSTEHYCYSVSDSSLGSPSVLATSAEVTVSVNPPLTDGPISPSSPTVDNGQSIILNASPTGGTTPYHYQWFSGTSPTCSSDTTLMGTLATQTVSPTSSTYYCYTLTDSSTGIPAATSSSVTNFVIVNPALAAGAISPAAPAIDLGQTILLTANPSGGTSPLSYQWYSDATCGSMIPSANQATYSASPTSTSPYSYKVSDSAFSPVSVCSSGDTVTVNPALIAGAVTPSSPSIDTGQSVTLSSHASGGTGPLSFQWFADGTCTASIPGATSSTYSASPTSPSVYSYKVFDSAFQPISQCSPPVGVAVNPTLVVGPINPASPTIDSGQTIVLSSAVTGGTTPYSYQWFSDGSCASPISGATSPSYPASPTSTTTYSYKATDSAVTPEQLCSSPDTVVLSPALGAAAISPASPTINKGQLLLMTSHASGGTPSLAYQWYGSAACASPIAGATSPTYLASPITTTTYSYSVSDSAYNPTRQCSSSNTITVNPALQAGTITPSNPTIDSGQTVTLTANAIGGTAPYAYQWYSGSTAACSSDTTLLGVSKSQTDSPTVSTYYCYVTVDSSTGLPATNATSVADLVTVNPALAAPTMTVSTPINSGQPTTVTISWSGGTSPYVVTLFTSTSSGACTGLANIGQNSGVTSQTLTFTQSPTSTANFCATVADLTTLSVQSSSPQVVTVNPKLVVNTPTASPSTIDIGQSSTVSTTFTGGTSTYTCQWLEKAPGATSYNNLGTTVPCTSPASISTGVLATVGTWSFELQVVDSSTVHQPVTSGAVILTVQPPPGPLGISLSPAVIDAGQVANLTTVSSFSGGTSPYSCQWLEKAQGSTAYSNLGTPFQCNAGDKPSTLTGPIGTAGTWSFELQVTDNGSPPVVSTSNPVSLTVNQQLSAGSTTPISPSIDKGQSITLTANPSGGTQPYSYQWYSGTSSTCSSSSTPLGTASTQIVMPSSSTELCYTVTDSAFARVTVLSGLNLVNVNSAIVAGPITPLAPVIDNGQSITLTSNPSGGTGSLSYQWFSGTSVTCATDTTLLGTSALQVVVPSQTTYYCYRVYDASQGTPQASLTSAADLVTVNPSLAAGPISPNSPTIDTGQSILLSAHALVGSIPYSYEWFSGSSSSCTADTTLVGTTPLISTTPSSSTYYCYKVTDSSIGSPSSGATSATDYVVVNPPLSVSLPSSNQGSVDSGQTVSLSSSFNGGAGPYICQWLEEAPGASGFTTLGGSVPCVSPVSTSTGSLNIVGVWSFELNVTDSAQLTIRSPAATVTVNAALSSVTLSSNPSTINLGQSATITATSSFNGGTSPYMCQWLVKDPTHTSFVSFGASFVCSLGDKPIVNTNALAIAGKWSFELQVTDNGSPPLTVSYGTTVTVNQAKPVISAVLSSTSITAGGSITDRATLAGSYKAGGTVTYAYFTGTLCSGTPRVVGSPVIVVNGTVPGSASQTFAVAGSYSWNASYGGDINNTPAPGTCQALTVFAPPTLSLPGNSQTVSAGQTIRFVVNATGAGGCDQVMLSASNLPAGASFVSTQCFAGGASSIFSWTPSQAGDYKINFTATDSHGSVNSSQMTIHVTAPINAAPLPFFAYSIFGLVGFLAVLGVALLLRRLQTPKNKSKV